MLRENVTSDGVFDDWPYDRTKEGWPALTLQLKYCLVHGGLRESVKKVTSRDLWHKLRRTFATTMYAESGDIELVRDMLGHSSIDVTYRYIDKTKVGRKMQADYLKDPSPRHLRVFRHGSA